MSKRRVNQNGRVGNGGVNQKGECGSALCCTLLGRTKRPRTMMYFLDELTF
jgi:hypothetical protein